MNVKNKNILIVATIVITIFSILLVSILLGSSEKGTKYNDLCRQIDKAKTNKKDYVIIINNQEMLTNIEHELKEKYKDLTIIKIDKEKLSDKCFFQSLKDTGEYERLLNDGSSFIIGYKSGVYESLIGGGQLDFKKVESHLNELGIIKIPEIKEDLTYEKYKKKIEFDEYYLIAITEEDVRKKVTSHMKKIFPKTDFDVINIYSEEGKKIISDIKRFEEVNSYPRIFYFKKGKLIAEDKGATEIHLEQFKQKLEKID